MLQTEGKYAEAEPLYRAAIKIDKKVLGKEHPAVATDYNNLALLLKEEGKYAEAEPLFRQSIEIAEKVLGKEHPAARSPTNGSRATMGGLLRYLASTTCSHSLPLGVGELQSYCAI